jgi:hypothetical protein
VGEAHDGPQAVRLAQELNPRAIAGGKTFFSPVIMDMLFDDLASSEATRAAGLIWTPD